LASLARRISVERTANPLITAKKAVERFEVLKAYLLAGGDEFNKRCRGEDVIAGDWLWNSGVRFAQVIELQEDGKAKVHVRKRAATLNNVKLSFYVNLGIVAECDSWCRSLYEAYSSSGVEKR
jgi:hypothetical protein